MQQTETSPLQHSPLYDWHVAHGAKMADFGGWEMPIEYPGGGVLKEHAAVREHVGIFDVSHLGKGVVRGPGAAAYVNSCLTNDLDRLVPGQAQYTLCCQDDGGVVDDLIAYLRSPDEVFLIPNASNTTEVLRRLAATAPAGVEVENLHRTLAVIAVQGPDSVALLTAMGLPVAHDYMSFVAAEWQGRQVIVCRSGYTGEVGFELLPLWDDATAVWEALLEAGAGLGVPAARQRPVARDHPGAGAGRLGGRLEQAGVLGTRRAGAREGRGCPPAALGHRVDGPRHPPLAHAGADRHRRQGR
jgi:aminomethyltransferase